MTNTKPLQTLFDKHLDTMITVGFHALAIIGLIAFTMIATTGAKAQTADIAKPDLACEGRNLIADLAPSSLANAKVDAARVPNGKGLFWKIEKTGQTPSWLYGTMHVTDPRIANLPDSVLQAIDNADTVVIETLDLLDPKKAQAAILMNPGLTTFTDGNTLTSQMSAEDKGFVEAELNARGISPKLVARMKPWMIMSLVAASDCEEARKASGKEILDFKIINRAKDQNKKLDGLETITEQLSAMASLPIDFQINGLVETLRLGDKLSDITETMMQLYMAEEIALITPALKAVAKQLGEEEMDEADFGAFEAKIILARNYLMAERAEPILQTGNAFIAVGAMHLPGDEGVIELLRKQGYAITRAN